MELGVPCDMLSRPITAWTGVRYRWDARTQPQPDELPARLEP